MYFEVVRFLVGFKASKEQSQTDFGQTWANTFGLLDAATLKHHCEIVRVLVISCHESLVGLSSLFVVAGHFP